MIDRMATFEEIYPAAGDPGPTEPPENDAPMPAVHRRIAARAEESAAVEKELERLVVVRRASTVEAAPVRWAWEDRIPLAASTLIAGREGAGKGVFAVDLVGRWTGASSPGT